MITVRAAKTEECGEIYEMVRSMIQEWTGIGEWIWPGDGEGLKRLVFEEKKAGLAAALWDDELCGYCFYTQSASSLNCMASLTMENFYVKPLFRRKGVGTAMFCFMQKLAVQENLLGLEWFSLAGSDRDNAFFRAMGQVPGDKRYTYHWNNERALSDICERKQ